MEQCDKHTEFVAKIAVMANDVAYIKDRLCSHVEEGEMKGGYRDRLIILEQAVDSLKKAEWQRTIVAGLVGGFISQLTPEVFSWIVKFIIH